VKLSAGDLILLNRVNEHHLSDSPTITVPPNSAQSVSFEQAGEQGTGLVCGFMEFDHLASNPLLDSLPDYLVIKSQEEPWCFHLSSILQVLIKESLTNGPGAQVTLNRLTDVIFVLILREHVTKSTQQQGLMAALADPKIALALKAIYSDLTKDWDVELLAQIAAMSRSAFAKRFKALLDTSPKLFLTQLRMENAYRRLRDHNASIIEVALECGYATEAAFAKAFKRVLGKPPGAVKKHQ